MPTPMTDRAEWERFEATLKEIDRRQREERVQHFKPYPKQQEFFKAGLKHRERLFRAGNQQGKTISGAVEAAFHLTGDYPNWWQGRRWEHQTRGWVGGKDSSTVRDSIGLLLLGPSGDRGTGMIPKERIVDISTARGIADGVDSVFVRHCTGATSSMTFKSYDQGRERWQAGTLDWVWFDEEPSLEVYLEGLSRTNATGGCVWISFTPLLGISDVVMRFLRERSPDRADISMGIEDALHIPLERRQQIIDSYPEHERDARVRGVPVLGSGRVFPFPRTMLACDPIPIPDHWAKIGGMDIGWDHPTAAVKLAHDRDNDCVYVTNIYRVSRETPVLHAAALKAWGKDMPWAWPHDALQHDKGSGEQISEQYRNLGLNMIYERAQFERDRGSSVEAGIFDMLDRMQTNRLKVFSNMNEWFEEFELYHRNDGVLVKVRDDLMSATRYGLMMLRHALAGPAPRDRYNEPYSQERLRRRYGHPGSRGNGAMTA